MITKTKIEIAVILAAVTGATIQFLLMWLVEVPFKDYVIWTNECPLWLAVYAVVVAIIWVTAPIFILVCRVTKIFDK